MNARAQAKPYDPAEPKFAYSIDRVARAAGLEPLRSQRTGNARREIRLWEGFGILAPEELLRIVEGPSGVSGSRLFWWRPNDPTFEAVAEADTSLMSNAELFARLRKVYGCQRVRRTDDFEMCEATLPRGQTWAGILAQLDSLGVATLPDESELGPPPGMRPNEVLVRLDGVTLVVEVRDGDRYRSYSYWSPSRAADRVEIRTAAAISRVFSRVGRRD